ncbi:MAG: response regulator [Chloroflexaceae bacterium]
MPLRHIEIVDSDPTAALVTQRGLQVLLETEAEVTVAPSPDAAWLRCMNEEVDLLIVDPNPQSRAATSLVRALRAYRPHLPVMVLTAYDTPRLRKHMQTLGVEHYLAKPIDLLDLKQAVHTALEIHHLADGLPISQSETVS